MAKHFAIDLVMSATTADSFYCRKTAISSCKYYLTSGVTAAAAAATNSLSSNWGMGTLPLK